MLPPTISYTRHTPPRPPRLNNSQRSRSSDSRSLFFLDRRLPFSCPSFFFFFLNDRPPPEFSPLPLPAPFPIRPQLKSRFLSTGELGGGNTQKQLYSFRLNK